MCAALYSSTGVQHPFLANMLSSLGVSSLLSDDPKDAEPDQIKDQNI